MTDGDATTFGGYRVERELGSAGGTTVLLARRVGSERVDEITVRTAAPDAGFRAYFLSTAERAARLRHPNLVPVLDAGERDGRLWVATGHVDGVDAESMAQHGGVDVARSAHIVAAAARGLDEVHRAGLRHGDVKPADIRVVERPGEADQVLLTGYGIARAPAEPVAFPAPEQRAGEPVDHRADIYALGCVLYRLLTGIAPEPGAAVPRPSRANPWVPAAMDEVVARATAARPEQRYPDGRALAAAVAAAADPGSKPSERRRRALLPVALVLAVVLLAAGVSVWAVTRTDDTAAHPTATTSARSPELKAALWGAYAYVADAFPNVLPVSVDGIGFDDLSRCTPVDGELRAVSLYEPARVARVLCGGDADPLVGIVIECLADRSRVRPQSVEWAVAGSERWARSSGTGQLRWGDYLVGGTGPRRGRIEVYFDDPGRSFCRLQMNAMVSGEELRTKFWPGVPV
ncbi:serine/threonine-protein kinase [Nocardia blacklockiae]|uniref:serine/threonine-protein kinase n=1 Tax=Nocardia blacklockiae TaxID=480036 RepID=UPI001894B37C|nr:serine/threonine-protein kinase [Nocardia blacklockiae]MBF6170496.1 serine/threonine protein kinase [Nocardia blacklockiae]